MDCDQVFMILTRGPFPTGESWDEQVETHLETCADCWRLAEALRPALEVFQEAVPPSEGRDLPGYWGDARPASMAVVDLRSGMTRTAIAPELQRICQPSGTVLSPQLASELSAGVFRAVVIVATIAAAGLALVTMLRG
ncbi:MAG TPA: hypothetical protein VHU84_02275 [Lacipirellulaceae bacterium]|jgi:hypothetical protein|nr:hypothetical protein [Lacipirellulaceae bacterium]